MTKNQISTTLITNILCQNHKPPKSDSQESMYIAELIKSTLTQPNKISKKRNMKETLLNNSFDKLKIDFILNREEVKEVEKLTDSAIETRFMMNNVLKNILETRTNLV
jgi:hypothetical protein